MRMDRPSTSKPRGICQFYNVPRGCFAGNKCKFLHGDSDRLTIYDRAKVCKYYTQGFCLRGDKCWFRHIVPSPQTVEGEPSEEEGCCICLEKPTTYGLLSGCSHIFCIQCIRRWRETKGKSKEVISSGIIKKCPLCRAESSFITPSSHFHPHNTPEREATVERFKSSMARTPCRYFQQTKKSKPFCPFGKDCFYQHINADGSRHLFTHQRMKKFGVHSNARAASPEWWDTTSLLNMLDLTSVYPNSVPTPRLMRRMFYEDTDNEEHYEDTENEEHSVVSDTSIPELLLVFEEQIHDMEAEHPGPSVDTDAVNTPDSLAGQMAYDPDEGDGWIVNEAGRDEASRDVSLGTDTDHWSFGTNEESTIDGSREEETMDESEADLWSRLHNEYGPVAAGCVVDDPSSFWAKNPRCISPPIFPVYDWFAAMDASELSDVGPSEGSGATPQIATPPGGQSGCTSSGEGVEHTPCGEHDEAVEGVRSDGQPGSVPETDSTNIVEREEPPFVTDGRGRVVWSSTREVGFGQATRARSRGWKDRRSEEVNGEVAGDSDGFMVNRTGAASEGSWSEREIDSGNRRGSPSKT